MGRVTLYLDAETERRMKAAAKAAGVSQSRWVANLIAARLRDRWPSSVIELAGAWKDLPAAQEPRRSGTDVPREPL